jgi:hypothetical protein
MPGPGQTAIADPGWHGQNDQVTACGDAAGSVLLRRGLALEYTTLTWNVVGLVVLAIAAIAARSVALAGFGPGFWLPPCSRASR